MKIQFEAVQYCISIHIKGVALTSTLMCVIGLTCILIFGNLTKYEESLLIALEHSPLFCKLIGLLLPYVLSMSIPFGFSLALSWVLAKGRQISEKLMR